MKKKEDPDYNKIRKEVKQSFYDYDRIFLELIAALNKCETKKELLYFTHSLTDGFKDAPEQLVAYLNASVKNKMDNLERREEIDLGKLRAISNNHFQ